MRDDSLSRDIRADLAAGEPTISLSEAGKLPLVLRNGKPATASTVWRWATGGIKVRRTGPRVVLEALAYPAGLQTTASAVSRFLDRLNPPRPAQTSIEMAMPLRGSRQREREIARAGRELDAAGIR